MQFVHPGALILDRLIWPVGFARPQFISGSAVILPVLGLVLGACLFGMAPAFAGGDGSGSDNPRLLRGGYPGACVNQWECPQPEIRSRQPASAPVVYVLPPTKSRDINCDMMVPGPEYDAACGGQPVMYIPPAATPVAQTSVSQALDVGYLPPAEPGRLMSVEPMWSIGLRGSYLNAASSGGFGVSVLPEFGVSGQTRRGGYAVSASGEIIAETTGANVRIARGALDASWDHAIDRLTGLKAGVNLSASQDSPSAPGTSAGIATQPLILSGSGNLAVTRTIGRVDIALRGGLNRQVYGETALQGGAVVDNSGRNKFGAETSLRASLPITRTVSMFVEGGITRDIYDTASPSLGVRLDSWTYAARAGLSGNWHNAVQGEVAVGYGLRRFDSATLNAAPAWLASASLTYHPEERLSFTAGLSSAFTTPETGTAVVTEVDYIANLAAQYRVNSRWKLRASLSGQRSTFGGAVPDGWSASAGAEADFALNKYTSVTADYLFTAGQSSGAAQESSHQIGLGVRYGR